MVRCVLLVACPSLFADCWLLCVVCCLLFDVCCVLIVVYYSAVLASYVLFLVSCSLWLAYRWLRYVLVEDRCVFVVACWLLFGGCCYVCVGG